MRGSRIAAALYETNLRFFSSRRARNESDARAALFPDLENAGLAKPYVPYCTPYICLSGVVPTYRRDYGTSRKCVGPLACLPAGRATPHYPIYSNTLKVKFY